MSTTATAEDWLCLIRAEYQEIPGLNLTEPQVRRLWGLDAEQSHEVLVALVERHFLRRTRDDTYVRVDLGA